MASITCRDCGHLRTKCPKNTRYCWLCRLIRDMDYWRTHRRSCKCGRVFAPLRGTDYLCSTCDPGLMAYHGPCVLQSSLGAHEGRYLDRRLPVCAPCARNPDLKLRAKLFRALERGKRERIASPPAPPEELTI